MTLKVWTVSQQVRIGLVGKDDKERSTATSRNEMNVNTEKVTRTLFTLKHLECA